MCSVTIEPLDLPPGVLALAEFAPTEDLMLAVLREKLPEVQVNTLIEDDAPPMFILVRRIPKLGLWDGDARFVDVARFAVHTFTSDPDGDDKGATLSEAIRVALRDAGNEHKVYPGLGSISKLTMIAEPARRTDWATSVGPVQYADLPTGVSRYETTYEVRVRKPRR